MATNTIKRHSTYPPLHFEFQNEDGDPVDCREFTVYLLVKNRHNVLVINSQVGAAATGAVWLDEEQGIGQYLWASGDTANTGRYKYEFKFVRNVDGKKFTIPEENWYEYLVLEDIPDADEVP